jgi:hypothetical protein
MQRFARTTSAFALLFRLASERSGSRRRRPPASTIPTTHEAYFGLMPVSLMILA